MGASFKSRLLIPVCVAPSAILHTFLCGFPDVSDHLFDLELGWIKKASANEAPLLYKRTNHHPTALFQIYCLGQTLKTYCFWSHKSHKQLTPDTYIFKDLFWSSSVGYIPPLPSALFLCLSALLRLWKMCMIRSFTHAAPFSHQATPKSPRPRLAPKAGLRYSRSQQDSGAGAALRCKRGKEVHYKPRARPLIWLYFKWRWESCFLLCPSILTPPPASPLVNIRKSTGPVWSKDNVSLFKFWIMRFQIQSSRARR